MNPRIPLRRLIACLSLLWLLAVPAASWAQNLGNAFHVPNSTEISGGLHMRNPEANIEPNTRVTIYSGNQSQGSGNPGNQTGGSLFYKVQGSNAPFASVALAFDSQVNNNKYWQAAIDTSGFRPGDVVLYYLQVNYSDHALTFVYGTDATSQTTATQGVAAGAPYTFAINSKLTVNGVNADYTTTHVFVNEVTPAVPAPSFLVAFDADAPNVDPSTVQVYTNLNRRDLATQSFNGVEEGIQPPSGDLVGTDDAHYYKAYAMTPTGAPGHYELTLPALKTGAYRLTARYRLQNSTTWVYYTSGGKRDHAVVISPTKSREIVLYEANTLNLNAQGAQDYQRGTFADFTGSGNKTTRAASAGLADLNYVKNLGCNFIWFQPIHPNGIDGRQTDPDTNQPYEVGSPYAVKNFFEVMPLMSQANSRAAAMTEFQIFVAAADTAGVGVMLDAPFNHTSYDAELSNSGVFYFAQGRPGWSMTDEIRRREPRFFSHTNDYYDRATYWNSDADTDIAVAPDRGDFGKFGDTYDVFYGSYSALVNHNPDDNGAYNNENDIFFYNDPDWTSTDSGQNVTKNVWKYFADYILFWLDQTGCPVGTPPEQADKGIDALRADFGQGLPPQAWEYIINKARSRKWSFVFMTESLDGGAVTYRSNRHFDILNENIVFPFQAAAATGDYRNIFESRRQAYGQGLVLLNSTSHDEENYADPFQALIRYTVSGSVDGVPLVFYGQENGVSRTFGYDRYETNFGKQITHFKKFNSLGPILGNRTFGLDQLFPVYAAVGQARQFSPALRSSNRYFLNQTDNSVQPKIFSVAKFAAQNASPGVSDVIFAFANLDRDNDQQGNFNVNQDVDGDGVNDYGLKPNRLYNVRNLAAYTALDPTRRDRYLFTDNNGNPQPRTGGDLMTNGLFVGLKRVPTTDAAWSTVPFEAQYLKVYDVTPPPTAAAPATPKSYALGHSVTFTWPAVSDPDGGVSGYRLIVGTTPGGSDVFNANVGNVLSYTLTNQPFGRTLYARVLAVNNAGVEGVASVTSAGTVVLDPMADQDGDGVSNAAEDLAGTDLFDARSNLRVTETTRVSSTQIKVTWTSVPGKTYVVQSTPDLLTQAFTDLATVPADSSAATTSYVAAVGGDSKRFFRVRVSP